MPKNCLTCEEKKRRTMEPIEFMWQDAGLVHVITYSVDDEVWERVTKSDGTIIYDRPARGLMVGNDFPAHAEKGEG